MISFKDYIIEKLVKATPTPEESKDNAGYKTSTNALLYNIGKNKYLWSIKDPTHISKFEKNWGISSVEDRDAIIKWQKETAFPIIPDSQEIIHRDEWEIDILTGVSIDALFHDHWNIFFDHINKNFKPQHDILLAFQCSNKKPYFFNSNLRNYISRYGDFCDFASVDFGLHVWDYAHYYPSRWDEFDHLKKDPYLSLLYSEITKKRILEFHKAHPYKKIIFIFQRREPQRPIQELWDDNVDNFREWGVILHTQAFHDKLATAYSDMNDGMISSRFLTFTQVRDQISKLIYKHTKDKRVLDKEYKSINKYSIDNVRWAYKNNLPLYSDEYNKYIQDQRE